MKPLALALALLGAAAAAGAADLSPTAAAVALSPVASSLSSTTAAEITGHSGFLYVFSFSNWNVFNGSPLAYTPFELGYAFGNGLRVQSGIDLFYYSGQDSEEMHPEFGTRRYDYEMSNWRTSLLYRVPMPIRLRPLLGLSLDLAGGSRKLSADIQADKDINAGAPKFSAWSYVGLGLQLGLEYLLTNDWSLQLSERYDLTFGSLPSPIVTQLGLAVTF